MSTILLACGNKQFEEAMDNGIAAVKDEKYEEAANFFEVAVDEKPADKQANTYLKQTESFIDGIAYMDEGDIKEAAETLEEVIATEDGLAELKEAAKEKLTEIDALETKYQDAEDAIKEAKDLHDEGKYQDAQKVTKQALETDLSHVYVTSLKKDLTSLEKDINAKQELQQEAEKVIAEAKKHQENQAYDEAVKEIDHLLDKDLKDAGLKDVQKKLEDLKADIVKEKEAHKKKQEAKRQQQIAQEKKQQIISNLRGYWMDDPEGGAPGAEMIHVTADGLMWLIYASDVAEYNAIRSLDVKVNEKKIQMHTTGNVTIDITLAENKMILNEGTAYEKAYYKVSKDKLQGMIDDSQNVDDLFDPDFIKGIQQHNES